MTTVPTAQEEANLIQMVLTTPSITAFDDCDGYGAPTASADGITKAPWSLNIFAVGRDTLRKTPSFYEPLGIGACGAALQTIEKSPQFWVRRVSLLRARAFHRMMVSDWTGAMKDLDAADAAAAEPDEVYYRRSLKVGIDLARAYVLKQTGKGDEADAMALRAFDSRPYDRQTAAGALIVIGLDGNTAAIEHILRAETQYLPFAANQLYTNAFEHGRFAEALDLFAGVAPIPRLGNEPMEFRAEILLKEGNRSAAELFWARERMSSAYALAALGRVAEARAAVRQARDRLAAATPDEPAPAPDASLGAKTAYAVHGQTNLEIANRVPPVLDEWANLVEARCLLVEGKQDLALSMVFSPGKTLVPTYATLDLLNAATPPLSARQKAIHEAAIVKLAARWTAPPDKELLALYTALPEAETADLVAGYHRDVGHIRPDRGLAAVKKSGGPSVTLTVRGWKTPTPSLEQLNLYQAAQTAQALGKTGVVVTAVRDITHTMSFTQYGQVISTRPDGVESQMDVTFVDRHAPVSPYDKAPWRVLDTDAILATLTPIFDPATRPADGKAREGTQP